jgi:two-component system, chemotaxis family, chemotaxis protein CheY
MLDKTKPVLVVDDSRTVATILCKIARQIGFTHVDAVYDGASALERLRSTRHELLIVDWEMTPMKGPQLIGAIRADEKLSYLPILMTTSHHQHVVDTLQSSTPTGANGYILKPFTADALALKIDGIFGSA